MPGVSDLFSGHPAPLSADFSPFSPDCTGNCLRTARERSVMSRFSGARNTFSVVAQDPLRIDLAVEGNGTDTGLPREFRNRGIAPGHDCLGQPDLSPGQGEFPSALVATGACGKDAEGHASGSARGHAVVAARNLLRHSMSQDSTLRTTLSNDRPGPFSNEFESSSFAIVCLPVVFRNSRISHHRMSRTTAVARQAASAVGMVHRRIGK